MDRALFYRDCFILALKVNNNPTPNILFTTWRLSYCVHVAARPMGMIVTKRWFTINCDNPCLDIIKGWQSDLYAFCIIFMNAKARICSANFLKSPHKTFDAFITLRINRSRLRTWLHVPLGICGPPAVTLTKCLKYKTDLELLRGNTHFKNLIKLTNLNSVHTFRVLKPLQWSLAKQSFIEVMKIKIWCQMWGAR